MRKIFAALLAAALLTGQSIVPSAHELDVARVEAGHHFCPGDGAKLVSSDAHEHHADADCRLCLGFSQYRYSAAAELSPAVLPPCRDILPIVPTLAGSPLLPFAAPRGPPSARA